MKNGELEKIEMVQEPNLLLSNLLFLRLLNPQGIIEYSQSAHYSQILMVPKPDGTFRMCVDYKALNDCTPDASWPRANIAEI